MFITITMDDETRYNNRQIERMLDTQSQDLKEHFDKAIKPLTEQVTTTNGRVKSLELKKASQDGYNRAMAAAGSVGVVALMGLFGWVLYQEANLDLKIQQGIQTALSPYNIEVKP